MGDTGACPIARGNTYYGTSGTIPSSYGTSVALEGRPHVSPDVGPTSTAGVKVRRSQGDVKSILVRNVGAVALLPGQIVTWAAGYRGTRVEGCARLTAGEVDGVIDDCLPSAGCRVGDICHLIVDGNVLSATSRDTNEIACSAGGIIFAATAATSGATTAGRFAAWNGTFSAAQTTDGTAGNILGNKIGRAVSAVTAAETSTAKLIHVQNLY